MAHPDHQLARIRGSPTPRAGPVGWNNSDGSRPCCYQSREDLCGEAIASIGVHKAKQAYERKHLTSVSYRLSRPAKCLA